MRNVTTWHERTGVNLGTKAALGLVTALAALAIAANARDVYKWLKLKAMSW